MLEHLYLKKLNYIERTVKRLRKKDESGWLSPVPCRDKRGMIKKYRYVNIKAGKYGSYGYNLLTEVNEYRCRVRDLWRHPEDMTEKEAQDAQEEIDETLKEDNRIKAELDKEQDEKADALDKEITRIKRRNKKRRLRRKEEKRSRVGRTQEQNKLLDYVR